MKKDDKIFKRNELVWADLTQNLTDDSTKDLTDGFTIDELRIIEVLASTIKKGDQDFKTYEFKIEDFMKFMGITGQTKYSDLPKAAMNLTTKSLKIAMPNGDKIAISLLSYVKHEVGTGKIYMRFDKALKPYLLNVEEFFTAYKLGNICPLKSKYSMRLYQLLQSYARMNKGEITIKVNDLKSMLGIKQDLHKLYANFKNRVIIPSQKEINNKYSETELKFEFEEIKEIREVSAIKFIIYAKNPSTANISMGLLPEIDENFEKLKKEMPEFLENDIMTIYKESGRNYKKVKNAYEWLKMYPDVKNIVGFMIYFVRLSNIDPPTIEQLKKLTSKKNRTNNNFEQRQYTKKDFEELEKKLLGRED